nr:response regulator [uncultured Vibrio sp.]
MYNIIIVEDELIEMESIERIVLQCVNNAFIHKASTGKKAIELIDDVKSIDMMLVDINIPLPNGKEVIEYLRSKHKEAKVIVTTANDDFDMLHNMFHLQIQDYLLKPVRQKILVDTIQKALGFDEDIIKKSKEIKVSIESIIEQKNYAIWNDFVLNIINKSYLKNKEGVDDRDNVKHFIDTLCTYLDSLSYDYSSSCLKLYALSEEVSRSGLREDLYPKLVFSLFKVGGIIFTNSLKKLPSSIDFINRAKFHIEKDIFQNITLDEIAEKTFVSSCYLSRAFKKNESIGFSNYITKRKLTIASSLLKYSNLKINKISLELAWKDSNYFCRIFKKEIGISPSDYREA